MYKPVSVIEVRIWDALVGAVTLDAKRGYYAFEYAPEFTKKGIELSPLAMPISEANSPFIFESLPEKTFYRLPALLADSLPDDFGNALINSWMASHGVLRSAITPLDRLAYMGHRGMGALEFRPERSPARGVSTAIELSKLTEAARKAVNGSFRNDPLAESALAQIIRVGTSAGGARAKAVIAWNANTEEIRSGQFEVPEGFEHWLLKFDGMGLDTELGNSENYGRIEFAYYKMAIAAGLRMANCRLLHENGRAHFMTKRFDRNRNEKYHLQTLCAMAGMDYRQKVTHDYNQLFLVMKSLNLPYDDFEEAFRRMVFNVLSANCDDHSKNFSFMMEKGGTWSLAPAYDITHAYNPSSEWTHQRLMSINGKFLDVSIDDCMKVAERFSIGTAMSVIKQVQAAISNFQDFAKEANLPKNEISNIMLDQKKFAFK